MIPLLLIDIRGFSAFVTWKAPKVSVQKSLVTPASHALSLGRLPLPTSGALTLQPLRMSSALTLQPRPPACSRGNCHHPHFPEKKETEAGRSVGTCPKSQDQRPEALGLHSRACQRAEKLHYLFSHLQTGKHDGAYWLCFFTKPFFFLMEVFGPKRKYRLLSGVDLGCQGSPRARNVSSG